MSFFLSVLVLLSVLLVPAGAKNCGDDVDGVDVPCSCGDIVVSDLVMNEVDGMELLGRSREALPDCEVILVTGHATVPKAVEAMQLGAYNFLEKPITPNRLRAAVSGT